MNMFKPTNAKTPKEYIDLVLDPTRRDEIKKLHDLIVKTVPKLKPYIQTGMIGYGKFHYKSKSGREGEWALIALASQKNYISVYVCAVENGKYLAEKYEPKFPKASIGRSCIRFKKTGDIDLEALTKLFKEAEKVGGFSPL